MARISKLGNDKHNPGEPLHHARGKSNDHPDCIIRHAMDVADIIAHIERNYVDDPQVWYKSEDAEALLDEVSQLLWRAALWSQELHEKFGGAPLAPGARLPAAEPEFKLTPEVGSYTKLTAEPERKTCTHLFRGVSARLFSDGSCVLCGEKDV
jgi:hypothetical protein